MEQVLANVEQQADDTLSAWRLVRRGIVHDRDNYLRNKGAHIIKFDTRFMKGNEQCDGNEISFTPALGLKWYKRCKGRDEQYWNKESEYEARGGNTKTFKNGLGLVASAEWKYVLRGERPVLLVLAFQRCFVKRGTGTTGCPPVLQLGGLAYSIVKSRQDLLRVYDALPPADRYLQEVILPSTPHKVVMDIEKDFDDDGASQTEMDAELDFLKSRLYSLFIPQVCSFFNDEIGVCVRPEDCYVTDSSKRGVKFSVHLCITTPHVDFFETRLDSWVCMALLARQLETFARHSAEFSRWFYFNDSSSRLRTTWDFSIYGIGARNMRMIGACKGKKKRVGIHWNQCRVFEPVSSQKNHDYMNFIATVSGISPKRRIVLSDAHLVAVRDYVLEVRGRENVPFWFQNSLRLAHVLISKRLVSAPAHMQGLHHRRVSSTGGAGSSSGGGGGGGGNVGLTAAEASSRISNLNRLVMEVRELGRTPSGEAVPRYMELVNHQQHVCTNFYQMAESYLAAIAGAIHPGNHVMINRSPHTAGSLLETRMNAWVTGHPVVRRLCYFGCTSGSHMVRLTLMVDFSVLYRCWACTKIRKIIGSPLRPTCVRPRPMSSPCPADFLEGFIDYAVVPSSPEQGDVGKYMRNIQPLTCSGTYLPQGNAQRTIIAQGPMGSGKTVMTRRFLERVRAEKPDATVVAFSFRKMLAAMFADAFGLKLYTDAVGGTSLYEEKGVAIQLESLERLGKPHDSSGSGGCAGDGNGGGDNLQVIFKAVVDVIIIDETTSVFSHFDSETMKDRVYIVWKLFFHLVKRCRCLVVCDADIGPRTFQFLRMTRRRQQDPETLRIPNLSFHYNTFVAIKTRFIDYAGEAEWFNQLLAYLVSGKNVFFFSNNKKHMRAIKDKIVEDVNKLKCKRMDELSASGASENAIFSDAQIREYDSIVENILVIDADMTEKQKKAQAKCNDTWVHRIVFTSPAIGAGIDFRRRHFHVAFGYATTMSCSPRAWNQMRGRVRQLIGGECHVYISEPADIEMQALVDKLVDDGPELNGDLYQVAAEAEDEQERDSRGDAGTEYPVTLTAALDELQSNKQCYISDMSVIQEVVLDGEPQLVTRTATIPRQLQIIVALNAIERNRGRQSFRSEFIRVLQMGDPDVWYTFNTSFNHELNEQFVANIKGHEKRTTANLVESIASQPTVDKETFQQYVQDDLQNVEGPSPSEIQEYESKVEEAIENGGSADQVAPLPSGPLPLPEGLTSEAELHSFHQKNKIKHFYDLSDDVPEEIWKEIVRLTGGDDVMERVHNFSILMGTGLKDLTENQEQRGSLRSMKVSLRPDGESGGGHQFSVNQRTAQELWPADSMLRWWTSVLLYASGFELPNPIDANSGCDYMRILPGIGCGGGHKIYSDERLNDTDLQEWLDTRGTFIAKHIGKKPGPFAPSEKPWDTKRVRRLTKEFMERMFNLKLRVKNPRKRGREETQDSALCQAAPGMEDEAFVVNSRCRSGYHGPHQGRCGDGRLFHVSDQSLSLMISLSHLYLHAPWSGRGNEPDVRVLARAELGRIVSSWKRVPLFVKYNASANSGTQPLAQSLPPQTPLSGTSSSLETPATSSSSSFTPNEEGVEEETKTSDDVSGASGVAENEDAYYYRLAQEEELTEKLSSVETPAEELWRMQMACALRSHENPAKRELKDLYIQQVVSKYLGTNPYSMKGLEYCNLLLLESYQTRLKRMRVKFAQQASKKMSDFVKEIESG